MSSAVIAAITARKVMYWKTRKKPNSGDRVCSQLARLSSMRVSRGGECRHHLLHLHETRALGDDRGRGRRVAERRDEPGDAVERAGRPSSRATPSRWRA